MPEFGITVSPKLRKRYLVFDVETTGLLPNARTWGSNTIPITAYPHILQLSFVIYDIFEKNIVREFDTYVKVSDDVIIEDKITEITGITREKCNTGKSIVYALEQFYEAYMFCDGLVGHNLNFDEKMIQVELERNRKEVMDKAPYCFMVFNSMYEKIHSIERYCTMKQGTELCNIIVESKVARRKPSKKCPKLSELYGKLFDNKTVTGLHNSMIDVLVCLKCYMKMRYEFEDPKILL